MPVKPLKPVPVMYNVVPPPAGPVAGLIPVTAGGTAAPYVNLSAELVVLVPPAVVTVTSTVDPAVPLGLVALIRLSPLTLKPAGEAPKLTWVVPVKLLPVRYTVVPPAIGPELGLTAEIAGCGGVTAAVYVNWSFTVIALVPPGATTRISTVVLAVPAGEVAVITVPAA